MPKMNSLVAEILGLLMNLFCYFDFIFLAILVEGFLNRILWSVCVWGGSTYNFRFQEELQKLSHQNQEQNRYSLLAYFPWVRVYQ